MDNNFIKHCLIILNDEEIKLNIKNTIYPIFEPLISLIFKEIYPWGKTKQKEGGGHNRSFNLSGAE